MIFLQDEGKFEPSRQLYCTYNRQNLVEIYSSHEMDLMETHPLFNLTCENTFIQRKYYNIAIIQIINGEFNIVNGAVNGDFRNMVTHPVIGGYRLSVQ